jgi:hypothetical protein
MKEATTTRRSSYLIAFLALFLIVAIQSMVWSFSNNPPLGKTTASGEGTVPTATAAGRGRKDCGYLVGWNSVSTRRQTSPESHRHRRKRQRLGL